MRVGEGVQEAHSRCCVSGAVFVGLTPSSWGCEPCSGWRPAGCRQRQEGRKAGARRMESRHVLIPIKAALAQGGPRSAFISLPGGAGKLSSG